MQQTRLWRKGELADEGFPRERIGELLEDPDSLIWLDLEEPDEAEVAALAREFGLSALEVEDATAMHERPKLDRSPDHAFLSMYGVALEDSSGHLATSELAVFVSARWLVTVRKQAGFDMSVVTARWDAQPHLVSLGGAFLLHGLIDTVVDCHEAAVGQLDGFVDEIDERLFDDRPRTRELMQRSHRMRRSLIHLRRLTLPMRDILDGLLARDADLVPAELRPYYGDVRDHVLRVDELLDSLRDVVATVSDTASRQQGDRANEAMKKLTAYAAIFAVPTAITGFYGQNIPYPGFDSRSGLITSTALLLLLTIGLYVLFKVKEWL